MLLLRLTFKPIVKSTNGHSLSVDHFARFPHQDPLLLR